MKKLFFALALIISFANFQIAHADFKFGSIEGKLIPIVDISKEEFLTVMRKNSSPIDFSDWKRFPKADSVLDGISLQAWADIVNVASGYGFSDNKLIFYVLTDYNGKIYTIGIHGEPGTTKIDLVQAITQITLQSVGLDRDERNRMMSLERNFRLSKFIEDNKRIAISKQNEFVYIVCALDIKGYVSEQ